MTLRTTLLEPVAPQGVPGRAQDDPAAIPCGGSAPSHHAPGDVPNPHGPLALPREAPRRRGGGEAWPRSACPRRPQPGPGLPGSLLAVRRGQAPASSLGLPEHPGRPGLLLAAVLASQATPSPSREAAAGHLWRHRPEAGGWFGGHAAPPMDGRRPPSPCSTPAGVACCGFRGSRSQRPLSDPGQQGRAAMRDTWRHTVRP